MAKAYRIIPELSPKDIERFWSKVDVQRPDECWLWKGTIRQENSRGYGAFHIYRHSGYFTAHRIAYIIQKGHIENPIFMVRHSCDIRLCCNGHHLLLGTHNDNMQDMVFRKRAASGDRNSTRLYPERLLRGERQKAAKLTEENVREIRRIYSFYKVGSPQLAQRFRVDHKIILNIIHGKIWRHVI